MTERFQTRIDFARVVKPFYLLAALVFRRPIDEPLRLPPVLFLRFDGCAVRAFESEGDRSASDVTRLHHPQRDATHAIQRSGAVASRA